jgi:hypothetical protein
MPVFLVESDEGVTGIVLMGRGQMRFSPTSAAERGQLRIFSGNDTLISPFEEAFVRLSPSDYEERVTTARSHAHGSAGTPHPPRTGHLHSVSPPSLSTWTCRT